MICASLLSRRITLAPQLQPWNLLRRYKSVTYFLTVPEKENFLIEELKHQFPSIFAGRSAACLVKTNLSCDHPLPPLAFAKQVIPSIFILTKQGSNASWAKETGRFILKNADKFTGKWRLHVITPGAPIAPGAGRGSIYKELFSYLRQKKASLLRTYNPVSHAPFSEDESLVQLVFTKNKVAIISIIGPEARKKLEKVVSPFPAGTVKVFRDKSNPPSTAYLKLLEAEHRMGYRIKKGQTVVDLGGSPGSWTRVALLRGALVTSVDWAKLHPKVMDMKGLKFIEGDAFGYVPQQTVDWLICDVANFPEKTLILMRDWLVKNKRCRFFVITLKFKIGADHSILTQVKQLMSKSSANYKLTCLDNNGNEVTCYGYFPELIKDVEPEIASMEEEEGESQEKREVEGEEEGREGSERAGGLGSRYREARKVKKVPLHEREFEEFKIEEDEEAESEGATSEGAENENEGEEEEGENEEQQEAENEEQQEEQEEKKGKSKESKKTKVTRRRMLIASKTIKPAG